MEGTYFGRYRLESQLGRGGMGEVWRAFDSSTDRIVALKVLPADLVDDDEFQRRFRREARIAASLHEPHVVPIHGYGEIDGRLYVDMRLVVGRDLATLLSDKPLAPARAVLLIEQVAAALQAAHDAELIHRDVKPSNVMVTDADFAYLIDFGLARGVDETVFSQTGHTAGTIAYMAPERFYTDEIDHRVDVYALACVLYQCLTAQQPFPGSTFAVQVRGHLDAPPPRPSDIVPGVPTAFDDVIAAGMAKDPEARTGSAREFAAAARAALAAAPTTPADEPSEPTTEVEPAPGGDLEGEPPVAVMVRTPDLATTQVRPESIEANESPSARTRWKVIAAAIAAAVVVVGALAIGLSRKYESTTTRATTQPPSTSRTTVRPNSRWVGQSLYVANLFPGLLPSEPSGAAYQGLTSCRSLPVSNGTSLGCGEIPTLFVTCNDLGQPMEFTTIPDGTTVDLQTATWTRASGSGRVRWWNVTGNSGTVQVFFDDPARRPCKVQVYGKATGQELFDSWFPNAPL